MSVMRVDQVPAIEGWEMGIDVSEYQLDVGWGDLAPNIKYAFIRATIGFQEDKFWRANVDGCEVPWGAYHALVPSRDPIESAKRFIDVTEMRGQLPPVLDFETAAKGERSSAAVGRARKWIDYVEQVWNREVMLYTYPAFFMNLTRLGANTSQFKGKLLWQAQYTQDHSRLPMVLPPWPKDGWTFWQASGNYKDANGKILCRNAARLPNGQDVDINWYRGTPDDLLALLVP